MESYVIYVKDNSFAQNGKQYLRESIKEHTPWLTLHDVPAITEKSQIEKYMKDNSIVWNYPWRGVVQDFNTNLRKSAYITKDKFARISCAIMHYSLWKKVSESNRPIFIFEHDAIFQCDMKESVYDNLEAPIVGINSPYGATRLPKKFDEYINKNKAKSTIVPAPKIDYDYIPQGLAGNSAYYITPDGGKIMLELVKKYGLWPNDALMCRQLVPGLSVTKTYFTKVQGLPSLTTD